MAAVVEFPAPRGATVHVRATVAQPLPMFAPATAPATCTPAAARPAQAPRPSEHLRRCTFRRLTQEGRAGRGKPVSYQVECLYAGRDAPLALGDLTAARRTCDPCTNPGIFRADED